MSNFVGFRLVVLSFRLTKFYELSSVLGLHPHVQICFYFDSRGARKRHSDYNDSFFVTGYINEIVISVLYEDNCIISWVF